MNPLNDKQRELAEANHDLIHIILEDRGLDLNDTPDWYGAAAVGLCEAAKMYTEDVGMDFRAFATAFIEYELKKESECCR